VNFIGGGGGGKRKGKVAISINFVKLPERKGERIFYSLCTSTDPTRGGGGGKEGRGRRGFLPFYDLTRKGNKRRGKKKKEKVFRLSRTSGQSVFGKGKKRREM